MSSKVFIVNEFSLKTDLDSYCWSTSDINIANRADFVNMKIGDNFKLVIGAYVWELMITRKNLNRQNVNRPQHVISAASQTFKLNYQTITKQYPSIYARDAVEDILGYAVTEWSIANWKIPNNILVFDNAKKIDAIRKITDSVKATIQTQRNGDIVIAKRYPVPPAYWEKTPIVHLLNTDTKEFSYSETFEKINTYNFVSIGNEDDEPQCEIETEIDNNGRGYVKLFPTPWRMMGLVHTSSNSVSIGIPIERQKSKCEIIEFQNGQAGVQKPVYQLVSINWRYDELILSPISSDAKTLFATGGKFNEGYSVAEVRYKYRYIEYPVNIPRNETIQFLAIEL